MGWKGWSYWLKGGIIGIVIGILVDIGAFFYRIGVFIYNLSLGVYSTVIFYFILFAVIGFIYGKIKERRGKKRNGRR